MSDTREKLIELIAKAKRAMWGKNGMSCELARNSFIADHLIASGVTVLEWIPAENPPKQDGKYLVAIINGGRFEISTRRYRVNPPKYQGHWARNTYGVRFWAELPKPPEVET